MSSGEWLVRETSGRLFKQASTCVEMVLKVRRCVPITLRRWCLADLTAASQRPPKYGVLWDTMPLYPLRQEIRLNGRLGG